MTPLHVEPYAEVLVLGVFLYPHGLVLLSLTELKQTAILFTFDGYQNLRKSFGPCLSLGQCSHDMTRRGHLGTRNQGSKDNKKTAYLIVATLRCTLYSPRRATEIMNRIPGVLICFIPKKVGPKPFEFVSAMQLGYWGVEKGLTVTDGEVDLNCLDWPSCNI